MTYVPLQPNKTQIWHNFPYIVYLGITYVTNA